MKRETQTEDKQRYFKRSHPGLGGMEHPTVEPPGARGHPAAGGGEKRSSPPTGTFYAPWRLPA